jgi:hypothetical protein
MGRLSDYASSFDPPPQDDGKDGDSTDAPYATTPPQQTPPQQQPTGLRRIFRRKKAPAPTAKRIVWVLVAALAAYFILIGQRGITLLRDPQVVLKVLGIAVLALPLVGAWVVIAELRFGVATQILAERMNAEGVEPEPELPTTASGRYDREAADALFAERKAEVELDPENWRTWYRLAVAYDYAGDRKRAREAMRTAIQRADLRTPPTQH